MNIQSTSTYAASVHSDATFGEIRVQIWGTYLTYDIDGDPLSGDVQRVRLSLPGDPAVSPDWDFQSGDLSVAGLAANDPDWFLARGYENLLSAGGGILFITNFPYHSDDCAPGQGAGFSDDIHVLPFFNAMAVQPFRAALDPTSIL